MVLVSARCFLGIDGGGTKTDCVLMDHNGKILARSRAGPSNPLRVGFDQAVAALQSAAASAVSEAHAPNVEIIALCVGLAGVARPAAAEQIRSRLAGALPRMAVKVCTDLEIALAAAPDGPAIVLIAGTGSAAIGRDALGRIVRAGGLGPELGDEGSAYSIGRVAIAAVSRGREKAGAPSGLEIQILRQLDCASWSALEKQLPARAESLFPRLFPVVAAAADCGDETAQAILIQAAKELAQLVAELTHSLILRDVPFFLAQSGGMFGRSAFFDTQVREHLTHAAPCGAIGPLPMLPAEAAARLALRLVPQAGAERK
jgi:glucosamine kinase